MVAAQNGERGIGRWLGQTTSSESGLDGAGWWCARRGPCARSHGGGGRSAAVASMERAPGCKGAGGVEEPATPGCRRTGGVEEPAVLGCRRTGASA
jgi:hypothetical protein